MVSGIKKGAKYEECRLENGFILIAVKLKDLKQGMYFIRKPRENPTEKQVFVREYYVREDKKYLCSRYSDVCDCIELKGDTIVYINFIF